MTTKIELIEDISNEIKYLKEKKNAVILSHNYQLPEIQDVSDFIGDSLNLSLEATNTTADTIVFCGVHFMAETASILCPRKTVLIPDLEAGCSLASTINIEQLRGWKEKYPNAVVVSYVNTTAEIKAESDYCCTSSNAIKIVNSIPKDKEILFLPDMFLGSYIASKTERNIHIWPGECHVHADMRIEDVNKKLEDVKNAEFLIHPECGCVSKYLYHLSEDNIKNKQTHILSTEGMVKRVKESQNNKFVIATEVGILHRINKEVNNKELIPLKEDAICKYMKMITLEKLHQSLKNNIFEIKVSEKIANKARLSIERMIEIT
tara:strand:- start:780 stop:1739 length:960 start_codon:yes stop_codon:yes gene_type:complete